ncbi:hypothetical protein [Lacrimispora sp.]|uniref:hypothetical protein n=1 Tax=Lacrimispora sp. TaxID=2719234 RepID=UPI00289D9DA9|nr:hypothetical protein [Lacrimispora sp.]
MFKIKFTATVLSIHKRILYFLSAFLSCAILNHKISGAGKGKAFLDFIRPGNRYKIIKGIGVQKGGILYGEKGIAYEVCFRRGLSGQIRAGSSFKYYLRFAEAVRSGTDRRF